MNSSSFSQSPPRRNLPKWFLLLGPIISILGLYQFTTAFFLAKKSMPHTSPCEPDSARNLLYDTLGLSEDNVNKLEALGTLTKHHREGGGDGTHIIASGCWMARRVDAMAVIVVDALRFDFALEHLPNSVGARLAKERRLEAKIALQIEKEKESGVGIIYNDGGLVLKGGNGTVSQPVALDIDIGREKVLPRGQSQLYQFVADPPTVTMQRLKGLTTGGLPTFADISGSFGGANVDEDSWVQQLHDIPISRRGITIGEGDNKMSVAVNAGSDSKDLLRKVKMAFVGDDTWVDLFPTQFDDSHPYPSFNTRDLDTVDNGCMLHLPRLLKSFGSRSLEKNELNAEMNNGRGNSSYFELLVTHFLGVDHVGHTYGSHNDHMDTKLSQMDDALQTILAKIDRANETCQVAFVFGDHGMTEDGNHGGGSNEETNAALFAHYSPGCGDLGPSLSITGSEIGSHSEKAFRSINQIDLVPTISLLLGLPIPFANLGGVVPALLPPLHQRQENENVQLVEAPFIATALALNAAQVWNYLATYSTTANKLPDENMAELKAILDEATAHLQLALSQEGGYDSITYREACGHYKLFLSRATALGKRVWTRFDTGGMYLGIFILFIALFLQLISIVVADTTRSVISRNGSEGASKSIHRKIMLENVGLVVFNVFHCVLLTFSNSYIISEQFIVMFILSSMCMIDIIFAYIRNVSLRSLLSNVPVPFILMGCSRFNEIFVAGHGLDPIIRKHWAHCVPVFITSLGVLATMRLIYHTKRGSQNGRIHTALDVSCISFLAFSWLEKRSFEVTRHGYLSSRCSLALCVFGFCLGLNDIYRTQKKLVAKDIVERSNISAFHKYNSLLVKVLLFVVTVTGPSAATSSVAFILQCWGLHHLAKVETKTRAPLVAFLWRLCVRHAFFATGHACSFNQLHFSAAFVAFETFHFVPAGISLFLNTFGWDILGISFLANTCHATNRQSVLSWFCFYQLVETVVSCISVSIMRRHLMVWAIFAPRFVFSTLFLFLSNSFNGLYILTQPRVHREHIQ